jgi:hypothetical protein
MAGPVAYQSDFVYASAAFAIRAARRFMTEASTFSVPHRDYFISRSSVDAAFASWIGKLIAAQGKTYIEQGEHFGHEDFMNAMHRAFLSGARVVALYSQSYLDSRYCVREATEALKGDPANEQRRLIPLRIEPCAPAGMLNITYTDFQLSAMNRQRDIRSQLPRIIAKRCGDGKDGEPASASVHKMRAPSLQWQGRALSSIFSIAVLRASMDRTATAKTSTSLPMAMRICSGRSGAIVGSSFSNTLPSLTAWPVCFL